MIMLISDMAEGGRCDRSTLASGESLYLAVDRCGILQVKHNKNHIIIDLH